MSRLLASLACLLIAAPASATQPLGTLDAATAEIVGGWAFDPDHPEAEIAVHVYVNGAFATNGTTTGFRPDVNAAYGLSGNHGFTIPVDMAAFGPGDHQVIAYAIDLDGEGNPALDGSPKVVSISCAPSCAGKACGDDGCGGSCGTCQPPQACSGGACTGGAGPPTGSLDAGTQQMVGGWAKDPDWDGPLAVHIYVDGVLVKALLADAWREDVGAHAFTWLPPPYGHGSHQLTVYAIGVDANGTPNGDSIALSGTTSFQASCAGLQGDTLGWCEGLPPYWTSRQQDVVFVGNDSVRVGVNTSYGGTIVQLYGPDWDDNLITEHGGGAVQLSIWGYDPVGGTGWFGTDSCDPTPWPGPAECLAAGHAACTPWAHSGGAHVSDCVTTTPCGGWTPGAPWNPIQAQAPGCGWHSPANDAAVVQWQGDTLYTRHDTPYHFTSSAPPAAMPMEQWVTAHQGFAEVHYRLTYQGPSAWSFHPQEIPAIFAAPGLNAHYYYYAGEAPFTGQPAAHQVGPSTAYLRVPGHAEYGHGANFDAYVREGWWGVCDASETRCLTVASFSEHINEVALHTNQSGWAGYLTALGWFNVQPGLDMQWTVYLFPHRYDAVVGGKTVRQQIYELAPAAYQQAMTPSAGPGPDPVPAPDADAGGGGGSYDDAIAADAPTGVDGTAPGEPTDAGPVLPPGTDAAPGPADTWAGQTDAGVAGPGSGADAATASVDAALAGADAAPREPDADRWPGPGGDSDSGGAPADRRSDGAGRVPGGADGSPGGSPEDVAGDSTLPGAAGFEVAGGPGQSASSSASGGCSSGPGPVPPATGALLGLWCLVTRCRRRSRTAGRGADRSAG